MNRQNSDENPSMDDDDDEEEEPVNPAPNDDLDDEEEMEQDDEVSISPNFYNCKLGRLRKILNIEWSSFLKQFY